jgi:hypothetical protein
VSRLAFAARRFGGDLLVLAGLVLVAYGAGQFAAPLGPIVLGLGLILAVRLGAR